MKLRFDTSALRRGSWKKQLGRFIWGGTITVATGLLAKWLGPRGGGLFLAFPAILPLSLVMLARRENAEVKDPHARDRGRHAAVAAAAGASFAAPALLVFAVATWLTVERWPPVFVWLGAGTAWSLAALLSYGLWRATLR